MALMLVLAALALLSFLVLLVLTVARNEDRASKASADIIDVRTLADLPAQLVISQLRRATGDLKTDLIWTSQPGLIRRFASGNVDDSGRSALYDVFKLYSSDHMVVLGQDFDAALEKNRIAAWSGSPTLYTDLNEPVPLRAVVKAGSGSSNAPTAKSRLVYPILDPGALKLVEGFAVAGAPGASEAQPLPMPVAWLYVLKDGRVIAPVGGTSTTATFQAGTTSATNPIVGRIAFWTDDESCKINLNTASEPAPWDVPRANSRRDRAYAAYQPARNEFHRQAGHPAFTALSPVFQAFGRDAATESDQAAPTPFTPVPDPAGITNTGGAFRKNTDSDAAKFFDYVESNHRPLPRTPDSSSSTNRDRGSGHGTQPPAERVNLKQERLFSTIDELFFDTKRSPMTVEGDSLSDAQTFKEDDIRKARFFLTTHSAAPETNPFNRPKISLWPVQEGDGPRTKTDRRLAMAATLSGRPFYWQRASVWLGEANPGSSQSTSDDAKIVRNAQIIGYLQNLASMAMPGYGGSLEAKYGGGSRGAPKNSDQIIISMFDMLRWGVNAGNDDRDEGDPYSYLPPGRKAAQANSLGEYSAAPMVVGVEEGQVRGFGRFPTITELALVFVATGGEKKEGKYEDDDGDGLADKTTHLRMFIVLEPCSPVPGLPATTPAVRYRIKGLENLTIENRALFGSGYANTNRCVSSGTQKARVIEGATCFNGLAGQFLKSNGDPKSDPGKLAGDENSVFPFVSLDVALPVPKKESETVTLRGGPLTVEILSAFGGASDDDVVQTLRIPLPAACDIPVPWLDVTATNPGDIEKRFTLTAVNDELRQPLILKGDVVRSVEADPSLPWGGDLRLLAALGTRGGPPVTYDGDPDAEKDHWRCVFPSPKALEDRFSLKAGTDGKDETKPRAMHSLRSGAHLVEQFGKADASSTLQATTDTASPLVPGLTYAKGFAPAVVSTPRESGLVLNGAVDVNGRLGDWTNGPGLIEDGPCIDKPDSGNEPTEVAATAATDTGGYFQRGGDMEPDETGITAAPHRQIASAVAFGSLPTGIFPRTPGVSGADGSSRPWQTLLFCPNPLSRQIEAGGGFDAKDHFGFLSPPDHTWLEFFWMPVMDPWPISAGFATEGKVNLNCEIMPFSYIKRHTALYAALRGVRVTAVPAAYASAAAGDQFYKNPQRVSDKEFRYQVNAAATLNGFEEERFKKGDVFRTASEICEMFLVPKRIGEADAGTSSGNAGSSLDYGGAKPTNGLTHDKMINWWNGAAGNATDAFEATGDNTRESPYAQLYPRLCTRSNVFQVHYRVQIIRKSRSTSADSFDLQTDQITADSRGSAVIERYLDPNDKDIPDMAVQAGASDALDDHYRFRIVSRQPFTP
ncbi:MAG: Verru_Chthon cassette protein A [Verrucomicrobiaceae bacterium]|nr:Verru_Chthon cassette protein A [Verrucomicrobiaceae bacterium]